MFRRSSLLSLVGLVFLLTLSRPSNAQLTFHSVASLSDSDKVVLTLRQLDRGIQQREMGSIIKSLSAGIQSDTAQVNSVIDRFSAIFARLDGLSINSGIADDNKSPSTDAPVFHLDEIDPDFISEDSAMVIYSTYLGENPSYYYSDVRLAFNNWIGHYGITNIFDLAVALDRLIDSVIYNPLKLIMQKPVRQTTSAFEKQSMVTGTFLKNKIVHPGSYNVAPCPVLTKTWAQNNFDGYSLFSRPFDVFETVIRSFDKDHWAMLSSDVNWDQIIHLGWSSSGACINAFETYNPLNYNYKYPAGITALTDQDLYICDKYNNRIARYEVNIGSDYVSDPIPRTFISDEFNGPVDIDAAHHVRYTNINPEGYEVRNRLAICDQGNNRIVITDTYGSEINTTGGLGSGPWNLNKPTSVAFGRNFSGWHNLNLYVADAGNRRIKQYLISDVDDMVYGSVRTTADTIFPDNAYLTSIDVDNVGQVYALDAYNSTLYVFTDTLSLIGTCGGFGADTNKFYYPNRIAFTRGWHEVDDPILGDGALYPTQFGDMLITEQYTDSTGMKRYQLTTQLLDFYASYTPRNCNGADDYIYIIWKQAAYSYCRFRIVGDYMLENINSIWGPGEWGLRFPIPYNAPIDADYDITLTLYSIYDKINPVGSYHITGQCDRDTCNYSPNFIRFPYIVDNDSCVIAGYRYLCAVDVEDRDSPEELLTYRWWSPCGYFDNPVTAEQDFFYDTLTTTGRDRVNLLLRLAQKNTLDEPDVIFAVIIEDNDGGSISSTCNMIIYTSPEICNYVPPPPSCPVLYWDDNGTWRMVNNLLAESDIQVREDVFVSEVYPVYDISSLAGQLNLRIAEDADEKTTLQLLKAFAIDYPDTVRLIYSVQNNPWTLSDKSVAPVSAVNEQGDDITKLLSYNDGNLYSNSGPGQIFIEYDFGKMPAEYRKPMTDAPGGIEIPPPYKGISKSNNESGDSLKGYYAISILDADGNWVKAGKLFPRVKRQSNFLEMGKYIVDNKLTVRLEHYDPIELDYIPFWFFKPADVSIQQLPLISAAHSSSGDIEATALSNTASELTLSTGQYLDLAYENPALKDGHKRLLLIASQGMYEAIAKELDVIEDFSFEQNYPNPFNPSTNFTFYLPVATHAKLRIYNILGQTVTVLVDNSLPAGRQDIVWDGRSSDGRPVASGIYFASLTAGDYTATRKIEVLK